MFCKQTKLGWWLWSRLLIYSRITKHSDSLVILILKVFEINIVQQILIDKYLESYFLLNVTANLTKPNYNK